MNFCKNIELNYERLLTEEYSLEKLFRPADYDWPGDWEGRALPSSVTSRYTERRSRIYMTSFRSCREGQTTSFTLASPLTV